MGESDQHEDLPSRLARAIDSPHEQAIRSVLESIREDAEDPVPGEVLARAAALSSSLPRPATWLESFDRMAARVLAPLFDDGPSLAHGLRGDDLRQCTLGVDDLRLDLEIEVDPARKDDRGRVLAMLRGQLDSESGLEGNTRVAFLEIDSGSIAGSLEVDESGRFDVELAAGGYEVVFRMQDGSTALGRIDVP